MKSERVTTMIKSAAHTLLVEMESLRLDRELKKQRSAGKEFLTDDQIDEIFQQLKEEEND